MFGALRVIKVNDILNYYENPRHAVAMSEKDTLKKLFAAVGNQYMLNLAEDINNNGLLPNQQLVVVYNDEIKKYVVYEGNRRIAAIKLLLNLSLFDFLDAASYARAEKLTKKIKNPIFEVPCYVTDEKEAFFIMERLHSGEDKGRGVKAWSSREKDIFEVRCGNKKSLSYLIDYYIKKYFDNFDITNIINFTTISRIFGSKKIKEKIGLDVDDEKTFTKSKMELIINISKELRNESDNRNIPMTRLYNRVSETENRVIPLIDLYDNNVLGEQSVRNNDSLDKKNITSKNNSPKVKKKDETEKTQISKKKNKTLEASKNLGEKKNLPYFFLGIDYSNLDPNDSDTHGILEICKELQYFSEKHLVEKLPIASAFLIRSAIEQSIKYYSKKTNIQGQNKLIWENIKNIINLSKIIDNYNKNLSNYITNEDMRQYFTSLFGNYKDNVDPLNWVVHRPAEFQLDSLTLIELPKKGLLTLLNYMISK